MSRTRSACAPRAIPVLLLAVPTLLGFAGAAALGWSAVFDDAFISYRYAKNLALGYGLTWNPGAAPTEGYTNFLLVVFLAPLIRLGADPLLATRIVSYAACAAIATLLYRECRRHRGVPPFAALLIASVPLIVPSTAQLVLTGLETVIYACVLLAAALAGVRLFTAEDARSAFPFAALLLAAVLLRPEAALLYPVVLAVALAAGSPGARRAIGTATIVLAAAGAAYLAWKYAYFGQLLPNPFFVKASGSTVLSPRGARTVLGFVITHGPLVALALAGMALSRTPRERAAAWICGAFGAGIALFFARTETLMDIHGRFLYPLVPLLALLAIPALARLIEAAAALNRPWTAPLAVVVLLLALAPSTLAGMYDNARALVRRHAPPSGGVMQRELDVARALARFPGIAQVRIAFADAGVIPYFTGAPWLDTVGLNDPVLARTKDRASAADYFFTWSPDLVIHPGKAEAGWLRHGHGPLGDYAAWAGDPRWDAYEYVGTVRTSGSYDLQFLVRRNSRWRAPLTTFLRAEVVDGWYSDLPIELGTGAAPERMEWIRKRPGFEQQLEEKPDR